MKLVWITLAICTAFVAAEDNENIVIDESWLQDAEAIYSAEHDIVNIVTPLNRLNFVDNEYLSDLGKTQLTLFIVEADVNEDGETVDQGIYIYKNGEVKKLLDHGRDVVAVPGSNKLVYFAAEDGIYKYNPKKEIAEKYGSLNDELIGITRRSDENVFYVLTKDNKVYKVTDKGNTKTQVDINNAQQIIVDNSDNLYYYTKNKKIYVITKDGATNNIKGVPKNAVNIRLTKTPAILDGGIIAVIDGEAFGIESDGQGVSTGIEFAITPSAYSVEATFVQFYAFNKTIYEYNFVKIFNDDITAIKDYVDHKKSTFNKKTLQSASSRIKNTTRPKNN